MKFGLIFVNTGMGSTPAGARQLAQNAEAAGFESLWTVEHVVVPSGYESKYPYDKSGKMAGGLEEFDLPDPLIWLTYAGAVTERIKLGTGILILPQRNPLVVAKELATLDAFTGGRVILGTGVGWLKEEFDALDVPFADRGRRHDDYVEALRALWKGDKASVHNTYANFDQCISRPVPANGTIPVVIGGHPPGLPSAPPASVTGSSRAAVASTTCRRRSMRCEPSALSSVEIRVRSSCRPVVAVGTSTRCAPVSSSSRRWVSLGCCCRRCPAIACSRWPKV